jgi:paraquat-inducible protein A
MKLIEACSACGEVQRVAELPRGAAAACHRCGWTIRRSRPDSLVRTAAFALAALVLYVPANVYPILRMNFYGVHSENTIWDGCVALFRDGQWLVAAIVFFCSIVIPLAKILGLSLLIVTTRLGLAWRRRQRTWIYRAIEVMGPWAMLDVFLLAVLVALVKFREIATVLPGPGLLAFTAVVVLTILASSSFDSRLIWQQRRTLP